MNGKTQSFTSQGSLGNKDEIPKKFLFLIDDGWRHEKKEILLFLRDYISFDIVTHDPMTLDMLKNDFSVTLIPVFPLKKQFSYKLSMFFARELDTNLVQYRARIKHHSFSLAKRCLHNVRKFAGIIGLRPYTYPQALQRLYRNSHHFTELLKGYQALVFMPVAVVDKRIIFEARNAGLQIINWIYSWDNPMKDNEFLPDVDRHLVWNEENRRDVHELHGVPLDKIDVVGPAQFDYLFKLKLDQIPPAAEPYVLYACALGLNFHLEQEINIIRNIRAIMDEIQPGLKLCVRPYPFRKNIDGYASLRKQPGIDILDFGEVREDRVLISEQVINERITQIQQALCLINLGSTIGLEAAFTGTPIIQLNFNFPSTHPEYQDVTHVLKNEHLEHMILPEYPNVVNNPGELKKAMVEILGGTRDRYMPYSKRLQTFANPLGVSCYKEVLGNRLASL